MYPKNSASPERIAVGTIYQISDGAIQTTGASVRVMPQGGAAAAGGGTLACDTTSGVWHYTPTQAETNYTSFMVLVYKASCTSANVTVVTTAESTAGTVKVGTNADKTGYSLTPTTGLGDQTADITGSISSVTGGINTSGGIITTLDALDTAQDTQHSTTQTAIANLNDIAAADVLAAGDIDGYTLSETLKLCLAALAGKLSGAATTTITIRAADDSKARITATVDADGNRTAITLDET